MYVYICIYDTCDSDAATAFRMAHESPFGCMCVCMCECMHYIYIYIYIYIYMHTHTNIHT